MYENVITIVGNVVNDPVQRVARNGAIFVAFRLASTARRFNRQSNQFEDGPTNYFNVTAFRALAANVGGCVVKGQPVIVTGRLRVNQFTRADNSTGTSVEIDAYAVGHDLNRGQATFAKNVGAVQMDPSDRLGDPNVQQAHEEFDGYETVDPLTGEVATRRFRDDDEGEQEDQSDAPAEGFPQAASLAAV